jgi:hypothetical protein
MTRRPRAERAVAKVKPIGVKLRKRPTSAVTAKLSPTDRVIRSIVSKASLFGKRVSVKQ